MKKLFYAGEAGDGFGWGVCSANLIRALKKTEGVQLVDEIDEDTIVFMPIADHGLRPASSHRGWKNIGYTFFEYPLDACAVENAKQYDLIFVGSTWCQERLAERGIKSKVLVQGIDPELFKPGPSRPPDGEFWIFSGGKFEYRKGQDIVLAAFKEILKTHPRARLITAWRNPWPQTMDSMSESPHIKYEIIPGTWSEQLGHICKINGIPNDRVLTIPGTIPNRDMAEIYRTCDLGLFPNRCEGGTNLVMMEFMACGKPVAATLGTGHRDVLEAFESSILTYQGKRASNYWVETDLDMLIGAAKMAIDCEELPKIGERFRSEMVKWTWERAARTIADEL